jgi:spore coat protein I
VAEKMSEVFEMYDVRLDHIGRGRGAMLLQTDKGVRQIRATTAGEKRLQAEYDFKELCLICKLTCITGYTV